MLKYLKDLLLHQKSIIKGVYLKFIYGQSVSSIDKILLINIPQNKFNRYMFPFVFMLAKNGYKPILNIKAKGVSRLAHDPYEKLIFKKKLFFLSSRNMKVVKKIELSPDYFNAIKYSDKKDSIIPMSMHPLIYARDVSVSGTKRDVNRLILFAGTNGVDHNKTQVFESVISRYEVLNKVKSFNNIFLPKEEKDYNQYENSSDQAIFLIFERHIFNLSQSLLLKEMSRCSFFLALPGRGMPLCHNLIEAMYCGCIPILQEIYAQMMPIPLVDNVNCLIYKNITDIEDLSNRINRLTVNNINSIRKNVSLYYDSFLSPKAISNQIVNNDINKFYLQAEGFSIMLYKSQLQRYK